MVSNITTTMSDLKKQATVTDAREANWVDKAGLYKTQSFWWPMCWAAWHTHRSQDRSQAGHMVAPWVSALRMHPPHEPFPRVLGIPELSESRGHCALLITLRFPLGVELELVSSKDIVFKCSMFSLNLREILDEMKTNHFSMFQWLTCRTKWQTGVKCGRTLWEWPESNRSTFVPWEKSWWQNVDCVHVCYVHMLCAHMYVRGPCWLRSLSGQLQPSQTWWTQPKQCRWRYKMKESTEAEKLAYHKDYVFYVFPSVYVCNCFRPSHCTN